MLPVLRTTVSLRWTFISTSPDEQLHKPCLMWEQSNLRAWRGWRDGGLISAAETLSHSSPHCPYFLSVAKMKQSIYILFHHSLICVRWDQCLVLTMSNLSYELVLICWEASGIERLPWGQTVWPGVNFSLVSFTVGRALLVAHSGLSW